MGTPLIVVNCRSAVFILIPTSLPATVYLIPVSVFVGQDGILRTDCQSVQPGAARPGRLGCGYAALWGRRVVAVRPVGKGVRRGAPGPGRLGCGYAALWGRRFRLALSPANRNS